ncbi:hypothetical protein [Carbonactinospora thermoautotrophica]|uniref:hypothetical protein n=1 Tax=Carbonactinospora thermoautotrophica TaxID=1469144 RepID=UPI001146EAA0|nr:hypothetical protein [Carbonactinospora thermoautotrophica]
MTEQGIRRTRGKRRTEGKRISAELLDEPVAAQYFGQRPVAPGAFDAAALHEHVTKIVTKALDSDIKGHLDDYLGSLVSGCIQDAIRQAVSEALHDALREAVLPRVLEVVRKAILEGMRARELHLAQLAVLDRYLMTDRPLKTVRNLVDTQLRAAGLRRVATVEDPSLFLLEDGEGEELEIVVPAYVDVSDGRLVQSGILRPVGPPTARGAELVERLVKRRDADASVPGEDAPGGGAVERQVDEKDGRG